ncbi:MAG: type II toxin-antitoxin system HicA family toxin [Actinobacteria bacterium]|nr:MAG: type II toxin-antitoxin system HicA family toxin [Actinomycetota bacterium]
MKTPSLRPKQVIKVLEKSGFYVKRQTGSHVIMVNEELKKAIPVPYHSKDLKKGTLEAILKRANVKKESLKKLL